MADIFIEVKAKSYQLLREELGIPEDEIWVEYPEHGLGIKEENAIITRTAEWEAIVTLSCTVIGSIGTLASGAKWLYEKMKKSQIIEEVEIIRREKALLTEAFLAEILKEAKANNQPPAISAPTPVSLTIPEQIQQLAVLHATGALTDEEFAAKKAELLARM